MFKIKKTKILACIISVMLVCTGVAGCTSNQSEEKTQTETENTTTELTATEKQLESYEKGILGDDEYVNSSVGIKYIPTNGFKMMDEKELALRMNRISETTDSKQVKESYKQGTGIFEMVASSSKGETIVVMINRNVWMDEERYIEVSKNDLQGANFKPIFKDGFSKRNVTGIEFYEYNYTMESSGNRIYQTVLVKSTGKDVIAIQCSYVNENDLNKLLAGFSAM